MRGSRSTVAFAALVLCLGLGPSAQAQGRRGGMNRPRPARPEKTARPPKTPIEEFQRMSPQERQKALDRLPPQQRKNLEERLQRFNQLPPEQQRTLNNMLGRLNQLPPERQEVVRKSMNWFSQQPMGRRQAMREELKGLAALPAEDRPARMSSPEFRFKFSDQEQETIRDMSDLLPPGV